MKQLKKSFEDIKKLKKRDLSPLIHHVHKKHNISKKTLFYMKEYGPHTNITKTIIKESIKILLLASIISSVGGLAIEKIKTVFLSILPLVILLPILNDMIGGYGTVISSNFSTMLHEGKITKNIWKNKELKKILLQVMIISSITVLLSTIFAFLITLFSNYELTGYVIIKVMIISILDVLILVSVLAFVSIYAGLYFYKKKEDPNNFLIPITTSIADFGNMLLLSLLVILFFT